MLKSQDSRNSYKAIFILLLLLTPLVLASSSGGVQGVLDSVKKGAIKFFKLLKDSATSMLPGALGNYCSDTVSSPTIIISAFLVASVITLLLAVFRYFLRKLSGQEFQGVNPNMELSAGIYHVAESIIILFFILIFYSGFVDSTGHHVFMDSAKKFTAEISSQMVLQIGIVGSIAIITYGVYNSFEVDLPLVSSAQFYLPIAFGKTLQPIIDAYGLLSQFIAVGFGEWFSKYLILCFIGKYALILLLPVGFIFRSMKLTEGFGNAIIALTLSLFFFYPMLLSIDSAIYEAVKKDSELYLFDFNSQFMKLFTPLLTTLAVGTAVIGGSKLFATFFGSFGMGSSGLFNAIKGMGGALISNIKDVFVGMILNPALRLGMSIGILMLFIRSIEWLIVLLGIFSFIFTILNIYLVVSLAYVISKALGTPLDLSALMRMI